MTFKIAAAHYLNSIPLTYALKDMPEVEYINTWPSQAARGIAEGIYDIALVPFAAYLQDGRLQILSQYCVASKGEVASVYLVSRRPFTEMKTLWIDYASRSSALLTEIYLAHNSQIKPQQKSRVCSDEILGKIEGSDAGLLIGDQALIHAQQFPYRVDLGEFYTQTFGLPFLYAVWVCHKEKATKSMEDILTRSAELGLQNRAEIANTWAKKHDISPQICHKYLYENLYFSLDDDVVRGAKKYRSLLHKMNLSPNVDVVSFTQKSLKRRTVDSILSDGSLGTRLSAEDGERLFYEASLRDLQQAAHHRRLQMPYPEIVTYIIERNVNYTNVCNVYCRFCAFYRRPGHEEGYVLSREQIGKKLQALVAAGGSQVLLQGGVHPDLKIEWYEDLFRWLRREYPSIRLHALSPDEIIYIAKVSNLSVFETVSRLHKAGLASVPGAGAEILVDAVRYRIARLKSKSAAWLDAMRQVHLCGLRSSATMMFGVHESYSDRIQHLLKIRDLQDETQGFTAFICWPYQQHNQKLRKGDTSVEAYLRTQAISRLMLDNINNIQSSWVTMGAEVGQKALYYGANDFGSVMFEENVVSAAGTSFQINIREIEQLIREAGFIPRLRDPLYQPIEKSLGVSS